MCCILSLHGSFSTERMYFIEPRIGGGASELDIQTEHLSFPQNVHLFLLSLDKQMFSHQSMMLFLWIPGDFLPWN